VSLSVRIRSRPLLAVATVVAGIATAGSLYLSLGLGLVPCELCWYQRILMYPLVVVLGVATYDRRLRVYRTVLPLSVLGSVVAAYHSWLQLAGASGGCSIGGCNAIQFRVLGLSIPNLALLAFLTISVLMLVVALRGPTDAAQ